jgi:Heavy-metal-associated domain
MTFARVCSPRAFSATARGARRRGALGTYTPSGYTGFVTELTYSVPGIHCGHCERAVKEEVSGVPGISSVDVDLEAKSSR